MDKIVEAELPATNDFRYFYSFITIVMFLKVKGKNYVFFKS